MARRVAILCLLLLAACARSGRCFDLSFSDVTEILRLGRETVTDVLESWELVRPAVAGAESDFPFVKRMEKVLRSKINEVSGKIDVYQEKMEQRAESIVRQLLRDLPMQRMLESSLRDCDHYVGQINDLYELFTKYASAPEAYEKYTMENFARAAVSPNLGALPDILKTIHRLIVPSNNQRLLDRSVLVLLANEMKEASTQICNDYQSPQQLLYNLYTTVALTEIKGYTMIQFSYMILRLYNKGSDFNEEIQLLKQQYAERTSETLRAVKTAMAFAPRDVWRCDPAKHKSNETYTELKQLFQGYIINEVDMNGESSCRENCGYYQYAKIYGCYHNQFCSQQRRCNGKLLNCQYIDSDMWVCPSARNSDRRYEYIEYENGRVYGQKGTCSRGTTKVDSWWRWLFWHCSYCFCYCDDHNSSSDRYFSLRTVVSNVKKNRVITGVRLTKQEQMIHIQIQEGQLLPRGGINTSTISWMPVDDFSVLDSGVKNGVDYHTIVWEKRGLDLDDLVSPENHLLTGLRFRMLGTRLNLEIMVTPFNFTTGELIQPLEKSYWHSNDVTDRSELVLDEPDIPIRSLLPAVPDSKINQYLNFGPSDRVKDAAQNTVPFIDTQPLEPKPAIPIAGAGLFHKGRKGSGGFVALKLFTYNFAPHLESELPPPTPVVEAHNEIKAV